MNDTTKNAIKGVFIAVWCSTLIIGAHYVFTLLKSEREHEWQNIQQYVLENGKYVSANGHKSNIEKPNILSVEFSRLEATHGEMLMRGSISINVYDPNEYFFRKPMKQKSETAKIDIKCTTERYDYNPIVADIECNIESNDTGTFCAGFTETVFVPQEGHLFDYPLDNLFFLITIKLKPKIVFDKIDFYNRVKGIQVKIKPGNITIQDSKIQIALKTERKNSIRIAFLIISISIFLYIILIIFFVKKLGILVSAVGAFFISVWSIRSLFNDNEAMVYPNLLDLTVIFASIILLIGILTRILFGKYLRSE